MASLATGLAASCSAPGRAAQLVQRQSLVQQAVQLPGGRCRQHSAPPLRRRGCRATAEREGTREGEKLQVPDTPPPKSSGPPPQPEQQPGGGENAAASQPAQEEPMSIEEIQRRAAVLRAQGKKESLAEGVLEEVRLIQWPSPKQALGQTLLVIAIVAGTSALLFAVNTALAELSRTIYS